MATTAHMNPVTLLLVQLLVKVRGKAVEDDASACVPATLWGVPHGDCWLQSGLAPVVAEVYGVNQPIERPVARDHSL